MGKVYLLILILFTACHCSAQVDTEFWFAPPEITSGHGDRPVFLRISTLDQAATVRVIQPAREDIEIADIEVPANTTGTINLSNDISFLETNRPGMVMQTGIRIISSAPVTAYYEVGHGFNADIFVLKGKNALGGNFVIPGQNFYNNVGTVSPLPYSSFDIVATRNNTVVTVKPSKPIYGHGGENLITIRLNAGETYSFRKTSSLASDNAIGTIVLSNKPIAITLKDDSVVNGQCYDLLGDQLVPVQVAGSEYIVMKGFLGSEEFLFITAIEDDTKIFVGGGESPVATLQAGGVLRRPITTQSTYVRSNKTIYAIHVTGFGCEMGMAVLPSIDCKGSKQIGFSRTTTEFFGLNVMVRKEGISHFNLNGSPTLITSSAFTPVPGTNDTWYAAQLSFESQIPVNRASLITNDEYSFQLGVINGDARTTCRYGYFSAFSTLYIGDDFELCEGETGILDAGSGKDSYSWNTGATTQTIEVSGKGEYWVRTENEECVLYDTIKVSLIDDKVSISIKSVSVDTLDEKNVNLNWAIEPSHLGSVFLHKRTGNENWQQFSTTLPNVTAFADHGVPTDENSHEYYASLFNLCDEEEFASNVHRTIHLTGSLDTTNDIINLHWNNYEGWENGVEKYELWRKLDDSPGYRLVTAIGENENDFSSAIGTDGFKHGYVIRAVERSGSSESWSNNVTFELEHPVYVPNVITPNGDTFNDYFMITKIELYQDSELIVFDRWGGEVFRSKNYRSDWDGQGLSTGVYYYLLDLKRNNKILKGTISILK